MSSAKSSEKKEKLTSALNKNARSPVWVYLKTKDRGMIRRRKRNWRYDKMKLSTPHKKKEEKRLIAKRKSKVKTKKTRTKK